jgi:hypothetical protein
MVVDGCGGGEDEATNKIIFKFIRILRKIQEMSQNFAGQFSKTTLNFSCHQNAQ